MQDLALSEGALPRHLHTSLFTISADQRMLTNRSSLKKVKYNQFLSNMCFLSVSSHLLLVWFIKSQLYVNE